MKSQVVVDERVNCIDNIEPIEFFNNYISKRIPLKFNKIINLDSIKTRKKCHINKWKDFKYLYKNCNKSIVKVEYRSNNKERFGCGNEKEMTFEKFLNELENGNESLYLTTQDLIPKDDGTPALYAAPLNDLINDFTLQPDIMSNLVLQSCNLWIGKSTINNNKNGSNSGLHHDFHDNLYVLLRGKKRFRLFSPNETNNLYASGKIEKIHTNGRINYVGQPTNADGSAINSKNALAASKALEKAVNDELSDSEIEKALENVLDAEIEDDYEDDFDDYEDDFNDYDDSNNCNKRRKEGRESESERDEEREDYNNNNDDDDDEEEESEIDKAVRAELDKRSQALQKKKEDGTENNELDHDYNHNNNADNNAENNVRKRAKHHNLNSNNLMSVPVSNSISAAASSASSSSPSSISFSERSSNRPPNFSLVDENSMTWKDIEKKFPLYASSRSRALEIEINAGEMLYLPAGWWHDVYSFDGKDAGHMAFNYWFHPPDQDDVEHPYTSDFWSNQESSSS